MEFFVGIDVSLDSSSICIVDERGVIIKEGKCPSEPEAIARFIRHKGRRVEHVGLETGGLSQWLHAGLTREGFRVTVMEARHVRASLATMRVKTDRNDTRGIAQLVRLGWFKAVHVKTPTAQETRALLGARQFLVDKVTGVENSMRAALRNFGLKMGPVTRSKWAARARELAAGNQALEIVVEALLRVRDALLEELRALDRKLLETARADPVVRTLMTAPGVGAIVALTFRSAVDDPDRFPRARDVGPWLGLTPSRYQSGQIDRMGRTTQAGDAGLRAALYEAAATLLGRVTKWSALKAWGVRLARRSGTKKARVAVARKLAVVLLSMWKADEPFRWSTRTGEEAAMA
ncbi:IS110 family RNA-guided transposase [Belnapia rosea]|uniref:Transposase n=1 Tax=Belnapia rosea TaxID=938405 RepID=A0A1G7B1Y2_9PROT|nr:IS110 family transposase [Belnapia rosea]SDB74898.1 Transposase [Belnapia rosea]SDE20952.1 Transposase [Belnapia rosea]